jgi:hypothetical protein
MDLNQGDAMIEMRWLVKNGERVLQYRQQVDTTIRAGMWPNDQIQKTANYQWSDWIDVPYVTESITDKCPKCGLDLKGAISYTCIQPSCPTGLGGSFL